MKKLSRKFGLKNEKYYRIWREKIETNISELYDQESGMFWVASIDCQKIDIWGSVFALA